ncbi:hypothetical protein P691DRAFT_728548 [Macrolepiota fuliginosa MF-IS2]|uniref:HNH nuclease domain-containing protein n=1 Tax=Macrolepiota fuliginosa MF-IS2 TaxID=1400762 RepID=A0A9P6C2M2_9AGAR|nr:hypothetical protein P691DRAFT_728548 [Macrolepiota fuliginosa MF-IS2]
MRFKLYRREGRVCGATGAPLFDRNATEFTIFPAFLHACHILPLSFANFVDNNPYGIATTWSLLECWTGVPVKSWLQEHINEPENAILLSTAAQELFNTFTMWFERQEPDSVTEPNTYVVKSRIKLNMPKDRRVTFKDHSGSAIPVPNPDALAIHAAFAKVLKDSGAVEHFADAYDEMYEWADWRDATDLTPLQKLHLPSKNM